MVAVNLLGFYRQCSRLLLPLPPPKNVQGQRDRAGPVGLIAALWSICRGKTKPAISR